MNLMIVMRTVDGCQDKFKPKPRVKNKVKNKIGAVLN